MLAGFYNAAQGNGLHRLTPARIEKMKCHSCGAEAQAASVYCPNCGARLEQEPDATNTSAGDPTVVPGQAVVGQGHDAAGREKLDQKAAARRPRDNGSDDTVWEGGYSP